jgi:hypothetical protein|tara:strand:- start:22 stop:174 length:153 start_codon:yes stop_codon:yes gene_type:complete
MFDEIEYYKKSIVKRIFFLRQAQERAQNPEMKKLWESKKEELLTNYLEQK